jgi:hypothetical protein
MVEWAMNERYNRHLDGLKRWQKRQAQIAKVDRWLKKHEKYDWLIASIFALLVLALSMLIKAAIDSIGGNP